MDPIGEKMVRNQENSEITIKDFLHFLKMAYQVNGNIEQVLLENGLIEAVNWIRMKESNLEVACQTEDKKAGGDGNPMEEKLHEILDEGLLDSILPHSVPSISTASTSSLKKSIGHMKTAPNLVLSRKKSRECNNLSRNDSEIIIHVTDEVKNEKRDFICKEKLLVEKMGYFAEVSAGQKLEDMEISVHCDINIFEWLMKWMKKDSLAEEEFPELDARCVISVLVSAAFLQMEPLLEECLLYCHSHMNEILRTSANFSCMNDNIITRLASKYTNTELENIKDRKDKIQSKLYFKLIEALCELEPEWIRGHWASYAKIFRCARCQQLISPASGPEIPCTPGSMKLLCDGSISFNHEYDASWNINEHVEELFIDLKSWKRVYWKMWGDCHFLFCLVCKKNFPVHQFGWCRFHPDSPQYFTLDAQKAPLPVGRYPCCGHRAFRFQLLPPESGCQFRDHTPCTENIRDAAIYSMFDKFRGNIQEDAPKLVFPERLTRLVSKDASSIGKNESNESFWWEGLQLIPERPKMGLLGRFVCNNSEKVDKETVSIDLDSSEDSTDSSTDSSSKNSEEEPSCSRFKPATVTSNKKRGRKPKTRLWQHNVSARSNQDLQRSYEETASKQMCSILAGFANRKMRPRLPEPIGGIWMKLENQFRIENNVQGEQRSRLIFPSKGKLRIHKPS